jgi:hypothetical protein
VEPRGERECRPPVLSVDNHLAVLTEARGRSKSEVELILRRLDPKPDVASTIRKVQARAQVAATLPLDGPPEGAPPSAAAPGPSPSNPSSPSLPPLPTREKRPVVAPLTPERYRIEMTVSKDTHAKLRELQNLLCREVRNGDPALIFDRALDALLAKVKKQKLAAARTPRPPRDVKPGSRDIPAHVQRTVWVRDEGRCAFEGKTGRCSATRFLEWHHVHPFGHQGPATEDNISLRCRAHNVYESEKVFGRFDPGKRRAEREFYLASREYTPFRNGGTDSQS